MLTKEQILNAEDLKTVPVKVKEWEGEVYVRAMTLPERLEFEELGKQGSVDFVTSLIVKCACDNVGTPIFSAEDVEKLKTKNSTPLMRIFRAATKLNGLTAADIKDLEKNSGEAQDEDSPSD